MSQIESFAVGIVLEDLHQQLLSDEDVTAVQLGAVIGGFEQLLRKSHRNEGVEVETALVQPLQLLRTQTNNVHIRKPTTHSLSAIKQR